MVDFDVRKKNTSSFYAPVLEIADHSSIIEEIDVLSTGLFMVLWRLNYRV